jgi:hypothetical protein
MGDQPAEPVEGQPPASSALPDVGEDWVRGIQAGHATDILPGKEIRSGARPEQRAHPTALDLAA